MAIFLLLLALVSAAANAACFDEAATRYGLPPSLLKAISRVESVGRPCAINRNRDGRVDIGYMQINSRMSALNALKTLFHGERFEPADAVPRALLQQITAIPRLTGILPYLGWMPDERLFVLDQGAFDGKTEQNLAFCIETVPRTGANEEMERVLASLFMSCPPGTGIQITLYASPHILPVLRQQANMLPVDAEVGEVDDVGSIAGENRRNKNIFQLQKTARWLHGTMLRSLPADAQKSLTVFNR